MARETFKQDQIRALRIAQATRQSSRGGEEKQTRSLVSKRTALQTAPDGSSTAGIASGPREASPKKKRAPKGTFDRTAYQREYMRKRRQAEQRAKEKQ